MAYADSPFLVWSFPHPFFYFIQGALFPGTSSRYGHILNMKIVTNILICLKAKWSNLAIHCTLLFTAIHPMASSLWPNNGSANTHKIYDYNHGEIVTISPRPELCWKAGGHLKDLISRWICRCGLALDKKLCWKSSVQPPSMP